jgi:FkbM family methyltransferase
MPLIDTLKQTVNRVLKGYGYRVERIIDYRSRPLNALDLALSPLDPRDPDFFFIQVGAHDGRRGDPIHNFVDQYHWRGLLLEPQPAVFTQLQANYRGETQLILENAALARQAGTLTLYTVEGASLRASFNREALRKHFGDSATIVEVPVTTVTFPLLMERHRISRVDLLVVDTEGFDYQVIAMALDAGLLPRLIRYEHLHLSSADRAACADLLGARGYRLLRDGTDTVALLAGPGRA